MGNKNKALLIGLLISFLAGVLNACASTSQTEGKTSFGMVKKVTVTSLVETSGNLSAAKLSSLKWGTSGLIDKVNVKPGDQVREGDILAELRVDSVPADQINALAQLTLAQQDLELVSHSTLTLAQAQQKVIDARKEAEEAENVYEALNYPRATDELIKHTQAEVWSAEDQVAQTYKRFKEVKNHPDGDPQKTAAQLAYTDALLAYNELVATLNWYIAKPTEADFEEAKIDLDVARAQLADARRQRDLVKEGQNPATIQSAEASVAAFQAQANLIRVIAPFDGEVMAVMAKAGDTADSGTLAMVIVDKSTLQVTVQVDESEIEKVEVGNPAVVILESLDDAKLTGEVYSVNPVGETVSGLVQFDVVINLFPTDQPLMFGSTLSVTITTGEPREELAVPLNAVQNDGSKEYISLVDDQGGTTNVDVTTGDLVESMVVIYPASEVNEGAKVVINATASTSNANETNAGPPDGGMMMPVR